MLEACRTCLGLIDVDNLPFYEIEADDVQLSTQSCRFKLLSLIPEMALNVTPKSMICGECHDSLEALVEFKAKCLKTENIITQYFQVKPDADIKNLDLKDVSAFNKSYNGDPKITATGGEFVAVKEEPESSGVGEDFAAVDESITVVKHEVDNYSADRVEVLQPENTVLESTDKFKCKVCLKSFAWRSRLERHKLCHERPNKCTEGFNDISALNKDDKHSEVKEHVCERCGRKLSSSKTLKAHMRLHNLVPKYACELCDGRYIDSFQLKMHMRTHTKPFRCDTCGEGFGQKQTLAIHMRKHTGEQPYTCTVCERSYYSKSNLKLHRCTGFKKEQPYQCDKCHKKFAEHTYLLKHMIVHGAQERSSFSCRLCKKIFVWKCDAKKHIVNVHKDVDIDAVLIEYNNKNDVIEINEEAQEM